MIKEVSSLLKGLEKKIEAKVQEKMVPIALKLDEMITILRQIEKHTRKGK